MLVLGNWTVQRDPGARGRRPSAWEGVWGGGGGGRGPARGTGGKLGRGGKRGIGGGVGLPGQCSQPGSWLQPGSGLSPISQAPRATPAPASHSCRLSKFLTPSQSPPRSSGDLARFSIHMRSPRQTCSLPAVSPTALSGSPPHALLPTPSQSLSAAVLPWPQTTHPDLCALFPSTFPGPGSGPGCLR